jgi:FKBP-type peptidyl-prolyl cis-trans isomerase SlyD
MKIAENCVASFHYTLTDSTGKVLDSSEGQEPLSYIHGAGNIIPGLEDALEGKVVGDKLVVSVTADQAYGVRDDSMIQELPATMFTGIDSIEVGMEFHAETEHGLQVVTVTKVEGDQVTIDGNHPLELDHGHVHGEGCDHH